MKPKQTFEQRLVGLQANLMNFACQLTANRDEARDLLQDMRNIFINNYRQTVRQATVVDKTEDLYLLNISQDSGLNTPEGSYAVKEISGAISQFSEEYRVPFNMYVAGYKYHEIAEKLGLPLGTVKSRIFFARKKLRDQLGDYR